MRQSKSVAGWSTEMMRRNCSDTDFPWLSSVVLARSLLHPLLSVEQA